ncbi:hypothetical protein D3C83_28650 [compost metagenome]
MAAIIPDEAAAGAFRHLHDVERRKAAREFQCRDVHGGDGCRLEDLDIVPLVFGKRAAGEHRARLGRDAARPLLRTVPDPEPQDRDDGGNEQHDPAADGATLAMGGGDRRK